MEKKSANQIWKEQRQSGMTNLDFKSWLTREKAKGFLNSTGDAAVPVNNVLNDSINTVIKQLHLQGGEKNTAGSEYVLGIKKKTLIWSGVGIVLFAVGVIIYEQKKKR